VAPGFVEDGEPADLNIPEADLTEKDCIELVMLTVNIPGMFGKPHLERTEAQCTPFGRQLHRYCQKKGIDPSDWVFDEFGLVVTGAGLVGGMYADHKAFKAANKKPRQIDAGTGVAEVVGQPPEPPDEIPGARPAGVQMSTMIGDTEKKEV